MELPLPPAPTKAGWRPAEFATAVGISRSMLYQLPPDICPRFVKFGTARIYIEAPVEFLARVATKQAA